MAAKAKRWTRAPGPAAPTEQSSGNAVQQSPESTRSSVYGGKKWVKYQHIDVAVLHLKYSPESTRSIMYGGKKQIKYQHIDVAVLHLNYSPSLLPGDPKTDLDFTWWRYFTVCLLSNKFLSGYHFISILSRFHSIFGHLPPILPTEQVWEWSTKYSTTWNKHWTEKNAL